jgi:hypothetical protein
MHTLTTVVQPCTEGLVRAAGEEKEVKGTESENEETHFY